MQIVSAMYFEQLVNTKVHWKSGNV